MQFKLLSLALLAITGANAAALEQRAPVCPSDHTALCCQTDALGVIALSCTSAGVPKGLKSFKKKCAKNGSSAECCTLALDGEGLICSPP